jgi:peptidoglycan hydrolase-like protein with peptidoglycan-binding domain
MHILASCRKGSLFLTVTTSLAILVLPNTTVKAAMAVPTNTFCTSITRTLSYGSTDRKASHDVTALQTVLKSTGIYTHPLTGYFGIKTRSALKTFQLRYGIVTKSTQVGYGVVGPKTRAFLTLGCTQAGTQAALIKSTSPAKVTSIPLMYPTYGSGQIAQSSQSDTMVTYPSYVATTPITVTPVTVTPIDTQVHTNPTPTNTVNITQPVVTPVAKPQSLSISISGNHFINQTGKTIQLRGVNYSGYEFTAIDGFMPADPSGHQAGGSQSGPNITALKSWNINVVRLPLNAASWLGYTCETTSGVGTTRQADPGNNYKQAIKTQVDNLTNAGMYVILDLHWTLPNTPKTPSGHPYCPMQQAQFADADNALLFWSQIATTYKTYPNVLFELFNEPFFTIDTVGDAWQTMMFGGTFSGFPATSGTGEWKNIEGNWNVASYQAMINTVRDTGAKNPVLVGTMQYSQDLSGWLSHVPTDSAHQLAAVWHPYPTFGCGEPSASAQYIPWEDTRCGAPNFAPNVFDDVIAILHAGYPVIATETGALNKQGTTHSTFTTNITHFADVSGISLLGWTWNVWGNTENVLIQDEQGTPTDGYGVVFKAWLLSHTETGAQPEPLIPSLPATTTPVKETPPPTVVQSPQPYIQSFTPTSGVPGTVVTISGNGFTGIQHAWAGISHGAPFVIVSDNEIHVTIPGDASTGAIGILNERYASFTASAFTINR